MEGSIGATAKMEDNLDSVRDDGHDNNNNDDHRVNDDNNNDDVHDNDSGDDNDDDECVSGWRTKRAVFAWPYASGLSCLARLSTPARSVPSRPLASLR